MNITYLQLGGNKGDKINNLKQAIFYIEKDIGAILKKSKIYKTLAWGNTNQPDFYNQVICVETKLTPSELLKISILIEVSLGRVRDEQKWMERTMDIDILFYNDELINTPDLTIPHPYIQERNFVLIPLCEIAPLFIHPLFNKNIKTILFECKDMLEVSCINC